jgi:CheY-like chemotaxis protein
MYLELHGFAVFGVQSGEEALPAIRDRLPDLVILDLMLPGLNGFETLEEVRRVSNVPVIMLTSRTCARSWSRVRLTRSTSSRCRVSATHSWIIAAPPRREYLHDAAVHLLYRPRAIDLKQQTAFGVVPQHRWKFLLEDLQTRGRRVRAIVGTPADCTPLGKTLCELISGNVEIDGSTDGTTMLLEPPIQCLSLIDRAREPVEHRSTCGVRLLESRQHDVGGDIVGQQIAAIHDVLRTRAPALAKQLATRDVRYPERPAEQTRLSTLACAWATKEHNDFRPCLPFARHSLAPHTQF